MNALHYRRAVLAALCVSLAACGSSYEPPQYETTGRPASPLGQVLDLEVELPFLRIEGAAEVGVRLELRVEIERTGPGRLPARAVFERAYVDRGSTTVEDLSDGRLDIIVTDDSWTTERFGPLRIDGTAFEMVLDGEPLDGGWRVEGISWESQSGLRGDFTGWRRHRFLVGGTDFLAGGGSVSEIAWVKERELRVRQGLEPISADPFLRATNGTVLAVNRFTYDNLQRLDPDDDYATTWQRSFGSGANPHDALVLSDEQGYVTRYEPPFDDVAVFSPRTGRLSASIPLGPYAENPDGTPRPDRIVAADGLVFVGLQDVDRTFTRFAEGKLAVIDPALDEVVGVIPLGGKNPGDLRVLRGGDGRWRIYVALAGIFPGLQPRELSGGVAVVDVANRALERLALDDDDPAVDANVAALALASERLGYVVVSDEDFSTNRVLAFDPRGGGVLRTVVTTSEFVPEIEVDGQGVLAVPERAFFRPRVCLYRAPATEDGAETLLACANLALPPATLEALD